MHVILTIDVESYTGDYEQEVFARGLGLEFIVRSLEEFGLTATFFVEALGATRWGRNPLNRICRLLDAAGQDIQLHLHPVVARLPGFEDRADILWKHDLATQTRLLSVGRTELEAAARRTVTAFRAGDLAADAVTLEAMRGVGMHLGANRDRDQKSSIRSMLNEAFPMANDIATLDGIIDVPVTTLVSRFPKLDGPYRHMEVSAMGWPEMRGGLVAAQRAGYACVGILTHPGEFFRPKQGDCVAIAKNCQRWLALLRFLANRPEFTVVPMAEAGGIPLPEVSPPEIRAPAWASFLRILEQGLDRVRARR